MVLFQTFDFFSSTFKLYTDAWDSIPLDLFNWFSMFMFISGVSVWFMVHKRLTKGFSRFQILQHGIKRYGTYLMLSLFLCLFCFEGWKTFLSLNEILGTIAVYALVSLGLLLICYSHEWLFIPFGLAMAIPYVTVSLAGHYPAYVVLPFFLFGMFFGRVLKEKNRLEGLVLLLTLLGALPFFAEISYKAHTFGFALLNTAIIILLFALAERFKKWIPRLLSEIGKHTLFLYLFHFVVLFKLAEALDVYQALSNGFAAIVTILGLAVAFLLCYVWGQ